MSRKYWHTKSTRGDKIQWLLNNQSLWEGWEDLGDSRKRPIVEKMRSDGLVSESTYWKDVNLTRLIGEARTLRRTINSKVKEVKRKK